MHLYGSRIVVEVVVEGSSPPIFAKEIHAEKKDITRRSSHHRGRKHSGISNAFLCMRLLVLHCNERSGMKFVVICVMSFL